MSAGQIGVVVVIAPDKFKGSLTAVQAAEAMAAGLRDLERDLDLDPDLDRPSGLRDAGDRPDDAPPRIEARLIPVADGGDGTVAATLAAGYSPVTATVTGPTGQPVEATIAVGGDAGSVTVVIELAAASGLSRLPQGTPAPRTASTHGTGELVAAALDRGAQRVVLGIGGSASTDGGTGLAAALGARFLDADGHDLPPGGAALADLDRVDVTGLDPRLATTEVVVASDVDNPLTGPTGAAAVYGPQKGATREDVAHLDAALARLAEVLRRDVGVDVEHVPGAGAAGGAGAGALAFLGATRATGIDLVLELVGFADAVHGADLVLTGEGALDAQTLHGKAPYGVARAAAKAGVPVIALAGRVDLDDQQRADLGVVSAHALTDLAPDAATAVSDAARLLRTLTTRVVGDWLAGSGTARAATPSGRTP